MKIAVEGCCHGELEKIYETLQYIQEKDGVKVCTYDCPQCYFDNIVAII